MHTLSRREAIQILQSYINSELPKLSWFRQIKPYCKAMIFYGSTAKGTNRPDSDLDLMIIVPLEIETTYTKGEYVYLYEQQEINIVLRSIEKLRKIAHDDTPNPFQSEIFRNCEILYESDQEVRRLITNI